MSMCYWAISGYGITTDKLSFKDEEVDIQEMFEQIYKQTKTPITWSDDGGDSCYVLYEPNPYYAMSDIEKSFASQDDIAKEIYRVLKPYLTEDTTEAFLIENIDVISTYGCS